MPGQQLEENPVYQKSMQEFQKAFKEGGLELVSKTYDKLRERTEENQRKFVDKALQHFFSGLTEGKIAARPINQIGEINESLIYMKENVLRGNEERIKTYNAKELEYVADKGTQKIKLIDETIKRVENIQNEMKNQLSKYLNDEITYAEYSVRTNAALLSAQMELTKLNNALTSVEIESNDGKEYLSSFQKIFENASNKYLEIASGRRSSLELDNIQKTLAQELINAIGIKQNPTNFFRTLHGVGQENAGYVASVWSDALDSLERISKGNPITTKDIKNLEKVFTYSIEGVAAAERRREIAVAVYASILSGFVASAVTPLVSNVVKVEKLAHIISEPTSEVATLFSLNKAFGIQADADLPTYAEVAFFGTLFAATGSAFKGGGPALKALKISFKNINKVLHPIKAISEKEEETKDLYAGKEKGEE